MKIKSLKSWLALFIATVSLMLVQNNQTFGQCISFTGPAGNVLTASIFSYPNYPNSDALFHVTVNDGNQPIPAGVYLGWCVDAGTEIHPGQVVGPGTTYTGQLFPDCDPNLNSELPNNHPASCYVSPAVWQQVNYILNHKNGANYVDIQIAIWSLVGGPPPAPADFLPSNPGVVLGLLTDASLNAATWVPQCGSVIGVVYSITNEAGTTLANPVQLVMIEVPYCPVTFTKCPNDIDLGCNPQTIPGCQNPVDTNLVFASSCCGYPVTITCKDNSDSTVDCVTIRYITYTASDAYGNTATCTQKITWTTDTSTPTIKGAPASQDLGCNPISVPTVASVKALLTASSSCSGPLTIDVQQQPDAGSDCARSRTFVITAASAACGTKSAPTTVVFSWRIDPNAPTITSIPAGVNLGCNPTNMPTDASVMAKITATDGCIIQSTNVTHVDTTNGCTVTRTFTIIVANACNKASTNTVAFTWTADTTGPVINCPPDITISNNVVPYCTFTPGDYGSACNGTNAASILTNCFKKIYTNGYVCGITNASGYCIKFTSCTNLQKFVPYIGNPGCLKTSYNNPTTSCEAGAFAGQAACLKLNVDLGDCKSFSGFKAGCGDLVLNDPTCPLHGKSIRQILGICNTALGGGNISSYGCTISNLSIICSNLNQSFQNCKPSTWCQSHVVPPAVTNVSPDVTGYATVVDKCNGTPTLTYKDVITAGTCSGTYVIARTWMAVDGCGNTNTCTQNIYVGSSQTSICGYVFTDCDGDGFLTTGFDSGISECLGYSQECQQCHSGYKQDGFAGRLLLL